MTIKTIEDNFLRVKERISNAAIKAGRDPVDIEIVAVSKGQPVEKINKGIASGLSVFGENYVQEGVEKISKLSAYPGIKWHMIGHIQSRKARAVVEHFTWVHSVDRKKLAVRLNQFCKENNKFLPVLLEFNMSGEESKFGIPAWEKADWEKLVEDVNQIVNLENLQIHGLMTMPPLFKDSEQARPFFVQLRELGSYLSDKIPSFSGEELSMGMSSDYEIAIEEGATIVRIGTAIFGPRESY